MNEMYALVTGASRGVGKSIALALAGEGAHVFINSHASYPELKEVQTEIETEGKGTCTLLPGDVSDPTEVAAMFDEIDRHCDGLNVLVNNAGIAYSGLLMEMSDASWQRIIDTDLSSVFYCCRSALPKMISKGQGKILNISSIWGREGASCEAAYSAAKAGVDGLTKALAKEVAASNIQVNALSLGVIDTSMNENLNEEEKEALRQQIPADRFGTPEEIARMVVELVHAPSYLTGQVIGIDGGF